MKNKLSLVFIFIFLIGIITPTFFNAARSKSILYRFCMANFNSKINKSKENYKEIGHYTCECFTKEFNSGASIKDSRIYCRDKAFEKYNL